MWYQHSWEPDTIDKSWDRLPSIGIHSSKSAFQWKKFIGLLLFLQAVLETCNNFIWFPWWCIAKRKTSPKPPGWLVYPWTSQHFFPGNNHILFHKKRNQTEALKDDWKIYKWAVTKKNIVIEFLYLYIYIYIYIFIYLYGIILPSYIWIVISQYKDPYKPIRIQWNVIYGFLLHPETFSMFEVHGLALGTWLWLQFISAVPWKPKRIAGEASQQRPFGALVN